jgi:hypothetical protein
MKELFGFGQRGSISFYVAMFTILSGFTLGMISGEVLARAVL